MDNKEVVSTLNDLIETCKDGEYGFRECAEHAKSESTSVTVHDPCQGLRAGKPRVADAGQPIRRRAGHGW